MKSNKYKAKFINFRYFLCDFFKWSGFPIFFWFRLKKIYESPNAKIKGKGGVLLAPNHVYFDDLMIYQVAFWYRRLHFTAMKELFANKFVAWFLKVCNTTMVDRDNFSFSAFREITGKLMGGNVVVVFPEGKINREANIQEYKSGFVLMAIKGNTPIVPIYRQKRNHWWQREKMVIGDPIDVVKMSNGDLSTSKINEISEYVRNKELELQKLYKLKFNCAKGD